MHESEKWKWSRSVVSDPQQSHELQPTRLLCPWDFPGKSAGVGCHCLLHQREASLWKAFYFRAQNSSVVGLVLGGLCATLTKDMGCLVIGLCCCCCWVASVMSDSVRPHRRQPTRLPHPWDSPGKNTGVGCHFLLQCMKVKSESEAAQSCPTCSDPMDCSYQALPSMGFSRQEYWSGLPSPSPIGLWGLSLMTLWPWVKPCYWGQWQKGKGQVQVHVHLCHTHIQEQEIAFVTTYW